MKNPHTGFDPLQSSVKLGDTRKGIWKGLRSEYGTSYSAMSDRPTEAEDNDPLTKTAGGQSGCYFAISNTRLHVLEVLRDKILGKRGGLTETRRFWVKHFGEATAFNELTLGPEDIQAFLRSHNLALEAGGMSELMDQLPKDENNRVPLPLFLEAIDPVNFPLSPALEPFLPSSQWAKWGAVKYGRPAGRR